MDLRHLRHFVAVAEELHFTRAAVRLAIEQSPLSRSIRNLEQRLGVELFERTKRATKLTPAGERFLAHARALLAAADEARIDVQAVAEDSTGHLRIGVCDGVPLPRLARLLTALRQEHPKICVHVHEVSMAQKIHDLRVGFLDAALAPESGYGKGIVAEPIWQDSPVAILPSNHPLAERERINLLDVVGEPLVLCRPDTGLSQQSQIEQLVRAVTSTPNIVDQANTLSMQVMMVFAGYGIGIATAAQLEAIGASDLALRPLQDASLTVKTWMMVREEAPSEPLSRFIDVARTIT